MKRHDIIDKLINTHQSFIDYVVALPDESFLFINNGKWTAGQQLDHIKRAVKPLVQILSLPKFLIKQMFGKANRQSKSYDDIVKKYLGKLENGGVATGRFVPATISLDQKEKLATLLSDFVNRLTSKINNYSEEELDTFIIPHPLLGKLTVREMMYFTIYHVEHHHRIAKRNLERNYFRQ